MPLIECPAPGCTGHAIALGYHYKAPVWVTCKKCGTVFDAVTGMIKPELPRF